MDTSRVLVVAGMSGVGKTTLINAALTRNPEWKFSVSATTRPQRDEEENGREYHFLSREEFYERRRAGAFLEYADVYGHLYGTPASELKRASQAGKHLLIEVDTVGCLSIKAIRPDFPLLAILPPSMEALEQRLRKRGTEDESALERRLENSFAELGRMRSFNFGITNDDVETATQELLNLMAVVEAGLHIVAPRVDQLLRHSEGA